MRILHTSDWHLGQTLFGHDRTEEQQSMLSQIASCAAHCQPDALLVSGDIYHNALPSAAVQKLFTDGLVAIRQACPSMAIIVTGGNHDSASRLEADGSLWRELGVYVVGRLHTVTDSETGTVAIDFDRHIIEIPGKGVIVALPHFYTQNAPADIFSLFEEEVALRNTQQLPVVFMAHLTAAAADKPEPSDHIEAIGSLEATQVEALGSSYAYIALGHIHRPMSLTSVARYCGSPVPVSFDEDYAHSVSLVTLESGEPPCIETISIDNPHPLVTIPATPVPFDEALAACAGPLEHNPYVRLNVLTDCGLPQDAYERAAQAVDEAGGRFCTFRLVAPQRAESDAVSVEELWLTPGELLQQTPTDLARRYLDLQGIADNGLTDLLATAIEAVEQEARM